MKLQKISEFQLSFSFLSTTENFDAYYSRFLESDLGKIHQATPWESLVTTFQIEERTSGSRMLFSPKGRIALMFLKHYTCSSDRKLIEQLNGHIDYQFFCDIHLGFSRLTNFKIVSQILLHLLNKLLGFEKKLRTCYKAEFTVAYYRRVATIKKVYRQQAQYFKTGVSPKSTISTP